MKKIVFLSVVIMLTAFVMAAQAESRPGVMPELVIDNGLKDCGCPPCCDKEVILDSDKDGVPDNLDKCPDTPEGVTVDKDGCPLDSDKDGVYDYKDKCPDTPYGLKVDEVGCSHEKLSIALNVEFDTAKAVVKEKYNGEIKKVADFMKKYPSTKAEIAGHTDNIGKEEYNKKLSQARADSIKQYLIDKFGIDSSRLSAVGYGFDKPIADNATEEGRQKNRRVEAVLETVQVR
jgi:OmpA-OmpF porin, OOP family